MNELIKFIVISGLILLLFLVTLILGITKKNKKLKLTSLIIFFVFMCMAVWTGFKFLSKTYNKVTETLRPRTGDEIYDALFEKRQTDCINVLHYQDQVVPKIDYAIWLHLETCPKELKRIISLHDFKTEVLSTTGWKTDGPLAHENWFKPESLGDSILVFTYKKDEYGNGQYIYSSLDSSIVFIKDVLD
jgi:hypothetical protein